MQNNTFLVVAAAVVIGATVGYIFSQKKPAVEPTYMHEESSVEHYGTGIGHGYRGKNKHSYSTDYTESNCLAEDCLLIQDLEYPITELPVGVQTALNEALMDEYTARATYEAIMDEFGAVRPFSMIIRSEEQHISSLKAIYDKYGVEIPEFAEQVTAPASLKAACQQGVAAEIANAALYRDSLLPAVEAYPEITAVFTNLMNASQDKHLPAFERCN